LEADCKRDISTGLATEEKGRDNLPKRRQTTRSVVVIIITMNITTLNTLAGHSNSLRTQATSKLTSPSAVQFVQGYRLEYVSCDLCRHRPGGGQQCDWSYRMSKILIASDLIGNM